MSVDPVMPAGDRFAARYGFARHDVTRANWRTAPYARWAFQNVAEIVPSARIPAGPVERARPEAPHGGRLLEERPRGFGGESVGAFLARSHTDIMLVARGGRCVFAHAAAHADLLAPHIVFSISKSLTALIAGMLEGDGVLDPEATVADCLPEAAASGYGDCPLRHLLDMRASIAFDESYLATDGDYARYRAAMLWNPPAAGAGQEGLAAMVLSLRKAHAAHGGPFRYLSPNTDVLGLVIERLTGERLASLLSERLMKPVGAAGDGFLTVDRFGTPRAAGGVSLWAGDLMRIGRMLLADGTADGRQVVPAAWLADMRRNGDREAWVTGEYNALFPAGRYRSQFYQTGNADGAFCAIGIHGQWLYMDPTHAVVIVKLASQPEPQDDVLDAENIRFLQAVARMA